MRPRQWWTQLCRDVTISVGHHGQAVDLASVPAGEYGHRLLVDVDITVAASIDQEIVSAPPAAWWPNWIDRLPDVLHRLGFGFGPGQQIVAVNEASDIRRALGA